MPVLPFSEVESGEAMKVLSSEIGKAGSQVQMALKRGDLTKKPCERCGAEKVEGHHEDYSKPLEVMWLCPKHHRERHKEIGKPLTLNNTLRIPNIPRDLVAALKAQAIMEGLTLRQVVINLLTKASETSK